MEEEPKITTVTKVKDPRRVAQGKRLAAISREAKAKKAKERQENQQQEESGVLPYLLIGSVIVVVATGAFGGYRYWKKEPEPVKEEPKKQEGNSVNRVSRIENFKKKIHK